jgi:hypothetical protein
MLAMLAALTAATIFVRDALPEIPAVTVDGTFATTEWAGGRRFALGKGELIVAREGGALLIGLRQPAGELRYADIYVVDAAGEMRNLHASMQQGERALAPGWDDRSPPFRWAPLEGWTTNIARHTGAAGDRPLTEQLAPYEGYEMRIPFGHLGRGPWRVHVELRDFEGRDADLRWPVNANRADPNGWAELTAESLSVPG